MKINIIKIYIYIPTDSVNKCKNITSYVTPEFFASDTCLYQSDVFKILNIVINLQFKFYPILKRDKYFVIIWLLLTMRFTKIFLIMCSKYLLVAIGKTKYFLEINFKLQGYSTIDRLFLREGGACHPHQ